MEGVIIEKDIKQFGVPMKIFILKNGPHKNKKSINIRC